MDDNSLGTIIAILFVIVVLFLFFYSVRWKRKHPTKCPFCKGFDTSFDYQGFDIDLYECHTCGGKWDYYNRFYFPGSKIIGR